MPEIDVDALLRSTGAILSGHFQLASGRHSDTYIEKFRIMPISAERLSPPTMNKLFMNSRRQSLSILL